MAAASDLNRWLQHSQLLNDGAPTPVGTKSLLRLDTKPVKTSDFDSGSETTAKII
jgi:hypothetical protein